MREGVIKTEGAKILLKIAAFSIVLLMAVNFATSSIAVKNTDCLLGRNLFGEIDIHLLGKSDRVVLDLEVVER